MIKFGTDGWRAITGKDFNEENVSRVILAIGKYVYDNFGFDKNILIGYDPRMMADEFAEISANILYQKGFRVKLSEKVVPTPVLAYNAKHLNSCAVMFTASHNPPEYLGIKFIPDYAGPATSEITDEIVSNLDKDYVFSNSGSIEKVDFTENYYEHIKTLIDFDSIKTLKSDIIYDGLYSASIGYFDKFLSDNNIKFKAIHQQYDTNFGGGMPDPKPEYLKELIKFVKADKNAIGLANDGDADRFGVINELGQYVSPNEIISILLKYLKEKGYEGAVVKTVGSSLLIDIIASKLNVKVIETPVGFKYVGDAMRKNKIITGGEESGGLSISGHIPEKDGILANLLVLEVMAHYKKPLYKIQEDLYKFAGKRFYTARTDFKLTDEKSLSAIMKKVSEIKTVDGFNVTETDTKDGVKLMLGESTKILVRPSGTEPLLRIYFETDNPEKLENLKAKFIV